MSKLSIINKLYLSCIANCHSKEDLLKFLDLVEVNEDEETSSSTPLTPTESMLLKVRAQMLDVNEQYVRDLDRWKLNTGGMGTDASKVQLKPAVNLLRPLLIRSKKLKRRPGLITTPTPAPPPPPPPPPILQQTQSTSSKPVFIAPTRPLFAATSGGFSGGAIPQHHHNNHNNHSLVKKRKADETPTTATTTSSMIVAKNMTKQAPNISPVTSTKVEFVSDAKKRRHRVNENGGELPTSTSTTTTGPSGVVVKSEERSDVIMRRIVADSDENRNQDMIRHVRLT